MEREGHGGSVDFKNRIFGIDGIGERDEVLRVGTMVIDLKNVLVTVDGEPVLFSLREFELLVALAATPGQLRTRKELAMKIWGDAEVRSSRTIDVHVRRVRSKLAGRTGYDYIQTVRGFGYRLVSARPVAR